MTSATAQFVGLLVAILVAAGGGVAVLMRISWRMGQLVERVDSHLRSDAEFKAEVRDRLRSVEAPSLPRRRNGA